MKLDGQRRELVLSVKCRHKQCGAHPGTPCHHYAPNRFHQVRYNDARRIYAAQAKLEDWNLRYGGLKDGK
jgi:hypothetical protein